MLPDLLSVFIAVLALGFSIGSFWWIHARSGELITYPVIVFGGAVNKKEFQLRLPVVLHNTGAKPAVIRGLQLRYVDARGDVQTMPAQTFHSSILPYKSFLDYVHAYVVPGRTVVTKYVRFLQPEMPRLVPGEPTDFVLQILKDERSGWLGLKTLSIHTGILLDSVTEMSNDRNHWREDTLRNGIAYQEQLFGSVSD